jgi:tetratricopeptide (TPR) repeat protein
MVPPARSSPPEAAGRAGSPRREATGRSGRGKEPPSPVASSPPIGLSAILVLAAGLTVFLAGFHSLIDNDVWFHLRAGSQVAHGSIPRTDTFSYPSAGRPYVDLHWLFQLILYAVYRAAGEGGMIWFACLVVTAAFALLYRVARHEAGPALAASITALGAIVASERFSPRPEIFTFLFLAITQWLLRRHREGSRRAWWWIPIITLLWVNSEGLFVLAYALLAAALLEHRRDRRLWQAFGLSLLASLINPYFVTGALHPLVLFSRVNRSLPIYSATIGEFLRTPLNPFSGDSLHPALAVFPFAGAAAAGRRLRWGELLLVALFTYLAISARRNVALLPMVSTPILARWLHLGLGREWLRSRWSRIPEMGRERIARIAAAAAILALAGYDLGLATNRLYVAAETNREFGTGKAQADFARGAGRFLRDQKIPGPIFTSFAAGSYMTWAYPEERVFIDGRLEVHTAEHYERYLRILQGGPVWSAAENEFRFNAAVIQYLDAMPLTLDRLRDPAWALVYLDDNAVVLLKRSEKNRRAIEAHTVTPATLHAAYPAIGLEQVDSSFVVPDPPSGYSLSRFFRRERFPWSQVQLGQFFFSINRWDLALAQFLEAVRRGPDQPGPRLLLASTLNQMGRPQLALAALQTATEAGGNAEMRARTLATRGDILTALGQPKEAVEAYSEYLRRATSETQVPVVLASRGYARYSSGDTEGAAADLTESLRRQPGNAQAYWYLGLVEEARGRTDAARRAYQSFLALGGHSPAVEAALKRLEGR